MYFVRIIDQNGFFVEDAFVDELTEFTIEAPCPDGFYLPKWDGTQWVEGKTAEEIAAIAAAAPSIKPTTEEKLEELAISVNDALLAIMMLSIE